MKRSARKLTVLAFLLVLAACGPEAGRERGAGFSTGGDPGNHPAAPQEMQPRSKVFTSDEGAP